MAEAPRSCAAETWALLMDDARAREATIGDHTQHTICQSDNLHLSEHLFYTAIQDPWARLNISRAHMGGLGGTRKRATQLQKVRHSPRRPSLWRVAPQVYR